MEDMYIAMIYIAMIFGGLLLACLLYYLIEEFPWLSRFCDKLFPSIGINDLYEEKHGLDQGNDEWNDYDDDSVGEIDNI